MHARLLLAAALLPLAAAAQVFKWIDSQGRTQYGDKPPEEVKAQPVKVEPGSTGTVGLAEADVDVLPTQFVWFNVQGLTLRELHGSKEANGPFNDIAEGKVWGQTGWWIRWKFSHDQAGGGCRIGTFTVTVHSRQWLPKWGQYQIAPTELREKWDAFYKGLRVHEDGHKANGIKAGNDLARRLRGMQPYPDCDTLNTDIVRIGERITSEYALVDRAFDRVERIYREGLR
jgi:predicted secreted Zn-dependent protease